MQQISTMVGNLRNMAQDMGTEVENQNRQLDRINLKVKYCQGLFLGTWLETHTWTMSRDVTDIHGDQADFATGEEGQSHFSMVGF